MEYQCESEATDSNIESDEFDEDQNRIPHTNPKRRSYVWEYFVEEPDNPKAYKCTVCEAVVGDKTTNLGRHLQTVHNIVGRSLEDNKRGRPSRSFIWKYCTRANEKQAFCHLCKKLLYFGGGNTSNISKHLRRKHAEIIEDGEFLEHDGASPADLFTKRFKIESKATDIGNMNPNGELAINQPKRKGASYVWSYCQRLSKYSVLCKLCDRTMRFHGTANVITHLQRKHKVIGNSDCEKQPNVKTLPLLLDPPDNEESGAATSKEPRRLNRNGIFSVVWRFCTRLNDDTVRCRICLKILAYQGTSNLQRHLHRMHNIVASGRTSSALLEDNPPSVLFDFCQTTQDPQLLKCLMCEELFEYSDDMEESIKKHMVIVHGMITSKDARRSSDSFNEDDMLDVYCTNDDVVDETNIVGNIIADDVASWPKEEMDIAPVDETKRFEALYDEIIEEDLEPSEEICQQPLSEQLPAISQEVTDDDNPLSPHSSVDSASQFLINDNQIANTSAEAKPELTRIQPEDTPRMLELKEELVRQQTIYFNEKAGFYRMQKYLVALQAKKERLEIEMLKNGHSH